MSELVTIRQSDLDRIITKLQELIVEVEELKLGLHDWEVVDPPCYPEGTTSTILSELHSCRGAENGPPALPDFCRGIAKARLTGDWNFRAKRAFEAGFWAQIAVTTCTRFTHPQPLRFQNCHWILLRGVGLTGPKRFNRKSDLLKFDLDSNSVYCEFASLAELHIFCIGAGIQVPELVRWKRGM